MNAETEDDDYIARLVLESLTHDSEEILIVFGGFWCQCCQRIVPELTRERRDTNYLNYALNWLTACADCHREDDANMAEQWADYYRGTL